jgi:anhydro-N-acetylmuramic acid kinase
VIVAGVMSGTSADGIDVALVEIKESRSPKSDKNSKSVLAQSQLAIRKSEPRRRSSHARGGRGDSNLKFRLLWHSHHSYPAAVRRAVLSAMNAKAASVAELARLNFLLGELYADSILTSQRRGRKKVELVGCHGQTLYHQGAFENFLGRKLKVTWQTGEGALIAGRVGVPVVSDFRPADMAAGGKGAPLAPFLDYILYWDAKIGRVAQNIGGIANLTAIPARATSSQVIAFDTGPGNMVIDAITDRLFGRSFDKNGRIAASGRVLDEVVREFLRAPFFKSRPPKTAGREEFGREFVADFLRRCGRVKKEDTVATATALTAHSIANALSHFVIKPSTHYRELIVSGGGAKNPTLMKMLATQIDKLGLTLRVSDEFGVPSEAKEAVAFALLAYQTWQRKPSNIPSATGAKHPAILGKISYV